jgi:hypothetical protein
MNITNAIKTIEGSYAFESLLIDLGAWQTLKTAALAQQYITKQGNEPQAEITPDCSSCVHADEGCSNIRIGNCAGYIPA